MKALSVNRKTIALMLLTVFLICSGHGISYGFFGGLIGAIGDAVGAVGEGVGAVGEGVGAAAGAVGAVAGIIVDVVADTVKITAGVLGLSVRIIATVIWHTDSLWDIELFPNGGIIGVVVSNLIHLWDPLTGETTGTLRHDAPVRNIAFSPDGLLLASANEDGTIRLWNPETQVLDTTLRGHTGSVLSIAFSPDGLLLASGGADGTVRLWDPQTQTLESTLRGHTGSVLSIAFSPDGLLLASGGADGTVRLWDPQTQTLESTLRGHTGSVLSIAFSPDGLLLASGGADGTVRLWNPQTEKPQAVLDHKSSVLSIAFSPEGEMLATGSEDGTARLWNLHPDPQAAKVAATLGHESPVRSVTFSPDEDILYSGSADGKMRQWEITIETETGKIETVDTSAKDAEFSVTPGENDTSLVVRFSDRQVDFFPLSAYTFQWRRKGSQEDWHEKCVEIEKGEVIIDNLDRDTTYQVRYSFSGFLCFSHPLSGKTVNVGEWSAIVEGTTSGASDTNNTATPQNGIVQIQPASIVSPAMGDALTLSLNITDGEAVAGYQASVQFDTTALRYVSSTNGDFLPAGAFFVEPVIEGNLVKLNAASLAGESNGDGALATLTFAIVAVKASTLTLSDVLLSNKAGEITIPKVENAQITELTGIKGDVNGDGTVNIADLVLVASNLGKTGQQAADMNGDSIVNIADLVLVAGALSTSAAAPSLHVQSLEVLTAADMQLWLTQAQYLNLSDATSQRGILFLEQLLAVLMPKETVLLANYPNPFNPETWIPYQLSKDAEVIITIYAVDGRVIRRLTLGHQPAGLYRNRSHAAYWDGRNAFGEPVASGVYFYTFTAGDFTATRKMLIRK